MNYIGDFAVGSNVHIFFSTNDGSGGRVGFSANIEVADLRVYKGVSTTERTSQDGWTLDETHDALVGIHSLKIDLSDDTDSGFYAKGNDYTVILYPNTEQVDGQDVSSVLCQFSIENRFTTPTTAAIADAVWDEDITEHSTVRSFGKKLVDILKLKRTQP